MVCFVISDVAVLGCVGCLLVLLVIAGSCGLFGLRCVFGIVGALWVTVT